MNKHLFANEQVMKHYLTSLLSEEEPSVLSESQAQQKKAQVAELSPVAKLLEQVRPEVIEQAIVEQSLLHEEQIIKPQEIEKARPVADALLEETPIIALDETHETIKELENQQNSTIIKEQQEEHIDVDTKRAYLEGEFQALFFEVAGLTLAVPLQALGGIHQLGEINQLFGKPKWFKGVMINREQKLSVIDTARWVMPEKYTPDLAEKLSYQYLIMLGDSHWGLSAEKLVNNITLKPDDVKWRTSAGKRPWLAGVIKEKMCALIDVENLIALLEKGLDSRDA
ncbi:CheW domain protein [Pseudoalteromonas luteoviolacea B = ATCC 29581]|nr:CheW domain protein [Pseudoalteromonas luteoviolacea B = ATCC 29581]